MHWKKLTNPQYLGGYDFEPKEERELTIQKITTEKVLGQNGQSDDCIVCYFTQGKPMILNATNCKAIAKVSGSNQIEDWAGCTVTLYTQRIKAFGDVCDALRIRPYKPKPKAKETLDADRFAKAIQAVKAGNFTAQNLKEKYTLSVDQIKQLNQL